MERVREKGNVNVAVLHNGNSQESRSRIKVELVIS